MSAACLAWMLSACGDSASPPPAHANRAVETPEQPDDPSPSASERADEPAPAPANDEAPMPAPAGRVRTALGVDNVAVIEHAERIEVGRMRVIGALQAEQHRFGSARDLAGYPLRTPLVALDLADPATTSLVASLLDDASYDFDTQRRCANDFFVGLRFTRGEDVVELALGMPCEQAFFVYRDGASPAAVDTYGALLRTPQAQTLVDLSNH